MRYLTLLILTALLPVSGLAAGSQTKPAEGTPGHHATLASSKHSQKAKTTHSKKQHTAPKSRHSHAPTHA